MDIVLVITTGCLGRVIGNAERGEDLIVVIQIHVEREAPLLEVVETGCAAGLFLGLAQRGQEQSGQNGDDGNDHQKFDQCKTTFHFHTAHIVVETIFTANGGLRKIVGDLRPSLPGWRFDGRKTR